MSQLAALAAFLPELGASLEGWADDLDTFLSTLDENCPGWRDLPKAKT